MMSKTLVRKAVIPIAGLGTRHFPASHAVKKELFPVVGQDGIARALFHYHLLELEAAGIEQICIITQPGEDAVVKNYLRGPDDGYLKRLAKYPALLKEAEQMRGFAKRVSFAVQHQQEGYGHAVYQTKNFAGGEMVLLGLGDHLFRGAPPHPTLSPGGGEGMTPAKSQGVGVSPYKELADMAAVSGGKSVSAVNRISAGELKGYGTIAGQRRVENARLIDISLIIEKPPVAVAQEKLHVDGLPPETWLGWFGMHLLAPSIYHILDEMIRDDVRDNGEFQLTRAQEIQRQRHGYLALEMTGAQRFDFGVPDDFVASVQAFRQPS
ncbi:MAG TPA: sugar phosphate nucleotidyltransferase [Verrucomicrobiae bacterium]|nr:sugar phosphate nucleotidyltransferase [Verrucomicrobiae bacterium]